MDTLLQVRKGHRWDHGWQCHRSGNRGISTCDRPLSRHAIDFSLPTHNLMISIMYPPPVRAQPLRFVAPASLQPKISHPNGRQMCIHDKNLIGLGHLLNVTSQPKKCFLLDSTTQVEVGDQKLKFVGSNEGVYEEPCSIGGRNCQLRRGKEEHSHPRWRKPVPDCRCYGSFPRIC